MLYQQKYQGQQKKWPATKGDMNWTILKTIKTKTCIKFKQNIF